MSNSPKLYHVSEEPDIVLFEPRASPSHFEEIKGNVVFAISNVLLHNYMLPRDCPRVTYYATNNTTMTDSAKFMGETTAKYIIAVESRWYPRIKESTLYIYEFSADHFTLLDACAGYYISYLPVSPIATVKVDDIINELLTHNVELRFMPSIKQLGDAVCQSTLSFSLIRMRNSL